MSEYLRPECKHDEDSDCEVCAPETCGCHPPPSAAYAREILGLGRDAGELMECAESCTLETSHRHRFRLPDPARLPIGEVRELRRAIAAVIAVLEPR